MVSLSGQIALVTGAARGNGLAIARGLADAGAAVALADLDGVAAERAAATLRAGSHAARGYALDVADTAAIRAVVARVVEELGGLDILVNNAGVMIRRPALELTEEVWDRTLAVNLRGLFFCAQAAARVMVERGGGAIVNISSTSAILTAGSSAAYYASKAGVIALTRDLAGEWGPFGIRVNAIAPGGIATAMVGRDPSPDEIARERAGLSFGRIGYPEDLAGPAVFLASDDARYVSGVTLEVDGGQTYWRGPIPRREP